MTLALQFEEILSVNNSDLYKNKIVKHVNRSMSVFFLATEKAMKEMKFIPKIYLSKLINIVLFMNTDEQVLLKFCVKCYEDSTIQEWRPLNSNEMGIFEWATGEPKMSLVLKAENLTYKDAPQLNGQILIASSVKVKWFTVYQGRKNDYFFTNARFAARVKIAFRPRFTQYFLSHPLLKVYPFKAYSSRAGS